MDSDPVATPVDDEVVWEGPVVHTPHVIVTLYKRSIQPLLLDESVAEWGERERGEGGREEGERRGERERGERGINICNHLIIVLLGILHTSINMHIHTDTHTWRERCTTPVQLPLTKWLP